MTYYFLKKADMLQILSRENPKHIGIGWNFH